MNLQATHPHPWLSAIAMDDKRVSKMILETAQMYCTATGTGPYKPTHQHHPMIPWCRNNLSWLIRFHQALAGEYYFRRGMVHSSFEKVGQHMVDLPDVEPLFFLNYARSSHMAPLYINGQEEFDEVSVDFQDVADPHYAYRCYMRARWRLDKRAVTWTRRPPPFWLNEVPVDNRRVPMLHHEDLCLIEKDKWVSTITEGTPEWLKQQRAKKGWSLSSLSSKSSSRAK